MRLTFVQPRPELRPFIESFWIFESASGLPARTQEPGAEKIIWEHGRRNFELRAQGALAIVCPVRDGSDVAGIGIFTGNPEETERIMDGDPAVHAGILAYEIHPTGTFPGSQLP